MKKLFSIVIGYAIGFAEMIAIAIGMRKKKETEKP